MDLYDSEYFRIQKNLLACVGLWPYNSNRKIISTSWLVAIFVLNFPQVIGTVVNINDIDKLMEHTLANVVMFTMFMKLFTLAIAEKKMKLLYVNLADNWNSITDYEEKQVLIKYSKRARLITIAFMSLSVMIYASFIFLPSIPMILNKMNPSSQPVPKIYILHGEFLVNNKDDYYAIFYLWDVAAVTCVIAVVGPIDMMFSTVVNHSLGLYTIARNRLLCLRPFPGKKDVAYHQLIEIHKLYQRILRYTYTLESMYSTCFFIVISLHIIALPLVSVMVLINYDEIVNFCRYVMFLLAIWIHLFNIFWPGQQFITHVDKTFEAACYNQWYEISLKARKLLIFFLIRSSKPLYLTAGGLMLLSFYNYIMIVKTAASYITVLASFR